jgi:UDP-glucose 4-epimerase
MTDKKNILITGVADYWGYRVAQKILEQGRFHVIGVDHEKPQLELKDLDFIQADVRNRYLVELIRSENIDTFCHLVFKDSLRPNETAFDINVMGTIKVLGACVEAGVRKVVIKSSTMVYGAQPTNPGFLIEDSPLNGSRSYGYIRDQVEIEAFCNGFRRQYPQIILTILRFPHIIGPTVDSPLTRFLSHPYAPMLLGFEPITQVIHERDVVRGLIHAIENDHPGAFNLAAEGNIPFLRMLSLVGKMPIPLVHLFAYWSLDLFKSTAQKFIPIDPDYLRYRWVADINRMRKELAFEPLYTAEEALREYAGVLRTKGFSPESSLLTNEEDLLRDTIERRRRERASKIKGESLSTRRQRKK